MFRFALMVFFWIKYGVNTSQRREKHIKIEKSTDEKAILHRKLNF
jgi:hypothetical protein